MMWNRIDYTLTDDKFACGVFKEDAFDERALPDDLLVANGKIYYKYILFGSCKLNIDSDVLNNLDNYNNYWALVCYL